MDPRVKTPQADLLRQFEMARQISAAQAQVGAAMRAANRLHGQLQLLVAPASGGKSLAEQIAALDRKVLALTGGASAPGSFEGAESSASEANTLRSLNAALGAVARAVESADVAPSADALTAFQHDRQVMQQALAQWSEIKTQDVPKLNASLKQASLTPVSLKERSRPER
jgi:hypothetical protein